MFYVKIKKTLDAGLCTLLQTLIKRNVHNIPNVGIDYKIIHVFFQILQLSAPDPSLREKSATP